MVQVQERFVLHLTDEEACLYMHNQLESSQSSLVPALTEQFHKMAQVLSPTLLLCLYQVTVNGLGLFTGRP